MYKAQLVTQSFRQLQGVDYNETFASVVTFTTLRLFHSMRAVHDLKLHQIDLKAAFLNEELNEDIYLCMKQPERLCDRK